jgi:hypothetical protein
MPCTVKKTFEAASDTGNALIAQVKANHPVLHDRLNALCATHPAIDKVETVDRNRHGRQEHRLVETFDVSGCLGQDWDGLIVTAARVSRLTFRKNTRSGLWDKTSEVSLYACQTTITAAAAGAAIRGHWAIENRSPLRANDDETTEPLKFSLAGEGQSSWSCNAKTRRQRPR